MEKHFNVICNRVKGRTLGKLFCKYANQVCNAHASPEFAEQPCQIPKLEMQIGTDNFSILS